MSSHVNGLLHGLYVITDEKLIPADNFTKTVELALCGGARIVQYRDKSSDNIKRLQQATKLKELCEHYQAIFIVNDDIELALHSNADGVHIGKSDRDLTAARKQLGNKLIGVSCYNQFELAITAEKYGADYIAFGSFFSSGTKPDAVRADTTLLDRAKKELAIPACAIGGITVDNAPSLVQAGASMVAVITDVWRSENIQSRCKQYSALF